MNSKRELKKAEKEVRDRMVEALVAAFQLATLTTLQDFVKEVASKKSPKLSSITDSLDAGSKEFREKAEEVVDGILKAVKMTLDNIEGGK